MSTTPIPAPRPPPTSTTPHAPPPSLANAHTAAPALHTPRAFPAESTAHASSNAPRATSQAPSEGSNAADKQFALVHQPSNGYIMDRSATRGKEGSIVHINEQVMHGTHAMDDGREGQYVAMQMQQQLQEHHPRPNMVPSSQDEPDVEDAEAQVEDEERTLADDTEVRDHFLPSAAARFATTQDDGARHNELYQQSRFAQHQADQGEYDDHREAYDDMGEGLAGSYAHHAVYTRVEHGRATGKETGEYDGEEMDQLDDEEEGQLQARPQMQHHPWQPQTAAAYADSNAHPGTAQHRAPSARIASDRARGQYRPPGPANSAPSAPIMANNGFVPPVRTGPPGLPGNRAPPAQYNHVHPTGFAPPTHYNDHHHTQHHAYARPHTGAQAGQAEQDIHADQRAKARIEAHVHTEVQAGRNRLVRRAGSKREHDVAFPDGSQEEEEGSDYAFDPTHELKAFDYDKELVQAWNEIQKDVPAAIMEYAEALLKNCFNVIFEMSKLFYKLNHDAGEDLEEGVNKIKEEEANQKKKREVILGFQKSVREVAVQLSQFGQSSSPP